MINTTAGETFFVISVESSDCEALRETGCTRAATASKARAKNTRREVPIDPLRFGRLALLAGYLQPIAEQTCSPFALNRPCRIGGSCLFVSPVSARGERFKAEGKTKMTTILQESLRRHRPNLHLTDYKRHRILLPICLVHDSYLGPTSERPLLVGTGGGQDGTRESPQRGPARSKVRQCRSFALTRRVEWRISLSQKWRILTLGVRSCHDASSDR